MSNWDPIFKAGTHTSSTGQTRHWSEADLDNLVKNTQSDAPIVIHHPADQGKAFNFGKIARLRRVGDELLAQYQDVPEILSKAVSEGLKLAKSVSIDPASMKIRHVGLLGANQPPAVAGLGPVSFNAGHANENNNETTDNEGEPLLTYMFTQHPTPNTENDDPAIKSPEAEGIMDPKDQKIQELEEKIKGLEADKTADKLKADLNHARDELKQEKEAHDAVKQEFAEYKAELEEKALEKRVDALADSGRINPADKQNVLAFARAMVTEEATMEFAAPDGTKETITPREHYLRDLEARPADKDGLLSEFARKDRADHSAGSGDDDVPICNM